ncbi:MAG: hypothetical protein ACYC3I_11355 [Gemmataceae bacterium]
MHRFTFLCMAAIIAVLPYSQAAPRPKRTNAKPAVIDARTEKNIAGVLWNIVWDARVAVREDEKVSKMDIVRKQKDWEAWLKKNLRVERVKETNLVHVSFQDGNAKEQAAIINIVVDYFLKNDIDPKRNFEETALRTALNGIAAEFRMGHITAEEKAKREEGWREGCEKTIRELPKLIEHAKVP